MRAFYERIQHGQKQRKKIAIVATARKLLTIMRAMLITGQTFDECLVGSAGRWERPSTSFPSGKVRQVSASEFFRPKVS